MPDVDFYLDGGVYKTADAILNLSGKDFYSNNGAFEVGNNMSLNFGDFINNSGTQIKGNSSMTINLTGRFSNDSTLTMIGEKAHQLFIAIKEGDFYNGVDHSSGQEYFGGSIVLSNTTLNIEKNLISEGVDKNNLSKIQINDYSRLFICGDLTNAGYSNFSANANTYTNVTNFTNKTGGEIHLRGSISALENFISEPGSKLYFSGTHYSLYGHIGTYGNIQANNINIKGALIYFSKGTALANTPYYFLNATTSLQYDPSLLGVKDILSDDGSINEFYEAIIEPVNDSKKSLKITFKPKEVDISDQSEKTIIDMFVEGNPIPGFDIKNLSLNQIRTLSKNINDGLQSYVHSKDTALNTGFEAIKANVFTRMAGGGSGGINYQKRSDIIDRKSVV